MFDKADEPEPQREQARPPTPRARRRAVRSDTSGSTRADVSTTPVRQVDAGPIQTKLVVGPAGDADEREADRIAAGVVADLQHQRAPIGQLPGAPIIPRIRPGAAASSANRSPIQAGSRVQPKAVDSTIGLEGGELDGGSQAAVDRAVGRGRPLDQAVRRSMEDSFGTDFSGVRVHTDGTADQLNQRFRAKAFTTGCDVFFRNGDYSPHTSEGQRLLAHELTHVVQQGGAGATRIQPKRSGVVGRIQRAPVATGEEGIYTDTNLAGMTLELTGTEADGQLQVFRVVETGLVFSFRADSQKYFAYDEAPGPEIAAADLKLHHLKTRIGAQAAALGEHETKLKAEKGAAHGRSRHGFQTGWQGQKERAGSKKTPDQPTDPMGTGVTTTEWTTSGGTDRMLAPQTVNGKAFESGDVIDKQQFKDAEGAKQLKKPERVRQSGGPYAGNFFSPEHQNRAEAAALAAAVPFSEWDEAEFTTGGWKPIQYLDVVLREQQGGYGQSFSKGKGKASEFVVKIEKSLLTAGDADMDLYLMLCAKVQLRREGAGWSVLSSFPDNLEPGVSPIFQHGKDPWTGRLRKASGETANKPAPHWT